MAVALATLPLKRVLAGDGDTLLTTGAGAGVGAALAAGLVTGLAATGTDLADLLAGFATGFTADLTGAAAFLATGLVTGFTADFLTMLPLILVFLTTAFFNAGFLATTFLTATFFATTFFATAFLATIFLAGLAFFDCALATAFLATGLETGFLAATGLATTFFAVALPTGLLTVFFAGVLALFTVRPFVAAAFGLPALATCVLAGIFPFCALAAVELRVVFAISLHRFWPWRPGVIAHVFYTSKLASGILVPLHAASRSGNVNIPTRLILWLLRLYKRWLSPLLGPRCRFHPNCSDYARIAVTRFGPWRGGLLSGWRLLRCQPLCTGGEDPVPEHFHYPRCRCQVTGSPKANESPSANSTPKHRD